MKVKILQNGIVIGASDLDPIDPGMGVAAGQFNPTSNYNPMKHACNIDGTENTPLPLIAHSEEFGDINCVAVGIEDYSGSLREINVTVLGMAYPEYGVIFENHPLYQSYIQ